MIIKQRLQEKIFRDTINILRKYKIPFWLDSDTLLGVMVEKKNRQTSRNENIFLSIPGDYLQKLLSLKKEFGFRYKFYNYPDCSGRKWIEGNISIVGIFNSWKRRSSALKVFISPKYKKGEKYLWVDNRNCKWISSHFFDHLDQISFNGNEYPVPSNVEDYLYRRYGNWIELEPDWIERIDDFAIVEDKIIKNVLPKKVTRAQPTIKIKLHEKKYHQRMKNMLLQTIDILQENNIPHWLEGGTLLGIIRDGDLIPWDYDADLGIPGDCGQKVLNIRRKFLPKYLVKKKTIKSNWLPSDIRVIKIKTTLEKLKQINFHIDLFCMYKVDNTHRWIDNNALKHVDKKFHEKLDTIKWEGSEVNIPSYVEEYLKIRYGNWKVPSQNYDAGLHDSSIAERGF